MKLCYWFRKRLSAAVGERPLRSELALAPEIAWILFGMISAAIKYVAHKKKPLKINFTKPRKLPMRDFKRKVVLRDRVYTNHSIYVSL